MSFFLLLFANERISLIFKGLKCDKTKIDMVMISRVIVNAGLFLTESPVEN